MDAEFKGKKTDLEGKICAADRIHKTEVADQQETTQNRAQSERGYASEGNDKKGQTRSNQIEEKSEGALSGRVPKKRAMCKEEFQERERPRSRKGKQWPGKGGGRNGKTTIGIGRAKKGSWVQQQGSLIRKISWEKVLILSENHPNVFQTVS